MLDVLVIDDAADIRLLVRALLTRADCHVREAESAADALASIARNRPDVVLLDVQMPDADGWSVLEALRREPATAELPVVLCTVRAHADERARGWRLGCDGYITKPFAIRELVAEVTAVVDRTPEERRAVRARALTEIQDLEGAGR
jgi:DNA-binding response OmpR family regulator